MNHDPIAHLQITAAHQREGWQRPDRPGVLALRRTVRKPRRPLRLRTLGSGRSRALPRLPSTPGRPSAILSE